LKEMILDIGINPEKYKINVNENMRKNGERIWVSWTNKPVFDEQGHVVEVMCIGNDITELKKHEEKLKRLIKRYEEYIGPVAKTIAKGILEE
jgi:PAS domain S-box